MKRCLTLCLVAVASLCWACAKEGETVVVVTVEAGQGVGDVWQFRFGLKSDTASKDYPAMPANPKGPLKLPGTFVVTITTAGVTKVDVRAEGFDSAGTVIAHGEGTVTVQGGKSSPVTLRLAQGPFPRDGGPGSDRLPDSRPPIDRPVPDVHDAAAPDMGQLDAGPPDAHADAPPPDQRWPDLPVDVLAPDAPPQDSPPPDMAQPDLPADSAPPLDRAASRSKTARRAPPLTPTAGHL